MYQGFEYARMLNISGFWICQGSKYTRVLNMPGLWIYQGYEYVSVLNMLGFWIYQGSEYTWFTQASECAWTSLENSWVGLIISEYAWIYLNISAYVWISLNLSELIFFLHDPIARHFLLERVVTCSNEVYSDNFAFLQRLQETKNFCKQDFKFAVSFGRRGLGTLNLAIL